MDQSEVGRFLKQVGFKADKMTQEWRHLLAFGEYEDKQAVFKLATTLTTGEKTKNEFNFNEAVHLIPESSRPDFTVPENYSSGHFGKLFYFICQYFPGDPLAPRESKDMSRVAPRIKEIARATWELNNLPIPKDCAFAQQRRRKKNYTIVKRVLHSAQEWASQVPRNLEPLLAVISSAQEVRPCVGHGDFVIRQMYDVDGKIGLIDGEHAGMKGPLYYDVAQFYVRLCSDNDAQSLARKYLEEYRGLLSPTDQKTFWAELKPVLIQRYVGDLWGAKNNPERLTKLEPLGKEILDDEII